MTQDVQFVAPFIVLEGDEGTGKGTVALEVVAKLTAKGIPFVHTREPGGTEMGEVLRQQLLMKRETKLEHVTHILLHQAYRKEHVEKVISPALQAGVVVLSERFFMSTLALNIMPYLDPTDPQSEGNQLYQLFMDTMPHVASGVIEPITFLLNIDDEEVRKQRLVGRELDAYESRSPEELEGTTQAYKMFQKHPTTITLDATQSPSDLADRIVSQIEEQIKLAKDQALEFAEQESKREQAVQVEEQGVKLPEELTALDGGVKAPVVEEKPFDLQGSVEEFLAENLVPALFNHDAEQVEKYLPTARSYVLSVYNQIQDPGLFLGQNRAQLRTNMHSIFHYGHQMDLLRERIATTPAAETV